MLRTAAARPVFAGLAVLLVATRASADRCGDGVAMLQRGDLSRAALYLDGCDGDDTAGARRELHKRLDASDLAVVEIVTRPAGLDATIDALPGETIKTPATVWIAAGTYHVRVGTLENTVVTKPHARSVVYLDTAPAKAAPPPPHDGAVDFSDDNAGEAAETGPPPPAQHPSLMPCKFAGTCPTNGGGEHLDDPFATGPESPPPRYPRWQYEVRGGAIEASGGLAPAVALASRHLWPWQDGSDHPWVWGGRFGYDARAGWNDVLDFGKVIAAPDEAWVTLGVGAGYATTDGVLAVAMLELALRRLPVAIGARYEQSVTEVHDRAVLLELGVALRAK